MAGPIDTLELEQTGEGIRLPVHAQPGARENVIVGVHAGRLKVAVTQLAEKGKANSALVKVLAKATRLKRSQFRLAGGATSRQKMLLVTGVTLEEFQQRLVTCLKRESRK